MRRTHIAQAQTLLRTTPRIMIVEPNGTGGLMTTIVRSIQPCGEDHPLCGLGMTQDEQISRLGYIDHSWELIVRRCPSFEEATAILASMPVLDIPPFLAHRKFSREVMALMEQPWSRITIESEAIWEMEGKGIYLAGKSTIAVEQPRLYSVDRAQGLIA